MTVVALPQRQPGWLGWIWCYLIALPWHAIKVYPPVLLIASSAAYASSEFAAHNKVFPEPFNVMQAIAFEWVYLGALALAGQRRGLWFYTTVGFGAFTSALYMFLHAADKYGLLALAATPEWRIFYAACHAIPLTLVGVSYMLLIHVHLQDVLSKEEAQSEAEAAIVQCRYCGIECKNQQAEYAHFRTCPKHPKRIAQ